MKFLKKIKSSNFWVSMISAVVLILQAVFNVDIKTEYLSQIIMAMLGVLVMTGIVSDSPSDEMQNNQDSGVDSVVQNLGQVFTQTIANMESNVLSIITQFEKLRESFDNNKSVEQVLQSSAELVVQDKQVLDNVELQIEDSGKDDVGEPQVQHVEYMIEETEADQSVENALTERIKVVEEIKTSNLNVL